MAVPDDRVVLRVEIDGAEWSQQPIRAVSLVFERTDSILTALRKVGQKVALSSPLPLGEDSQFGLFLEKPGAPTIILEREKPITFYKFGEKDTVIFRRIVPDSPSGRYGKKQLASGTLATLDSPLHKAALDGAKEDLIECINGGISVRFKDIYGQSILHLLVSEGNVPIVQWLLLNYPELDPNAKDCNGYTPVHLAAGFTGGDTGLVILEMLMDYEGVSIHGVTVEGYSVLHLLCLEYKPPCAFDVAKYTEILRRLVVMGLDVNQPNKQGETALHLAAWAGNSPALQFIVGNGGSMDVQTRTGQTPLHYAAKAGQANMFNYLLHKSTDPVSYLTMRSREGTAKELAQEHNHMKIVEIVRVFLMGEDKGDARGPKLGTSERSGSKGSSGFLKKT